MSLNEVTAETKTAATVYADRRDTIRRQIASIQNRLDNHAKNQAKYPHDWGFAGDLGRAIELLSQLEEMLIDENC